jgi:hypothetical protein
VHDNARRLVHDQHVVVLEGDPQRDLLALQPWRDDLWDGQLELLATLQPVALRPKLAVHERATLAEQPLGRRARADLGQRGEKAIEPLARSLGGDRNDD